MHPADRERTLDRVTITGVPLDYVLFGEQSDVVSTSNLLYFAGVNSGGPTDALNGQVVYYAFQYQITEACSGSWNSAAIVQGMSGGIPTSPDPGIPWRVTLAYGAGGLTLGFGEQDVLGSALATCNAGGNCVWVVLPDSVTKVSGLINGLTSYYSAASGNIGTVWVETSATSRTGYVVAFALIYSEVLTGPCA